MNKTERTFRLYAILVIFVLLTVMLTVINGINFTMAAQDADEVTQKLAQRQGSFEQETLAPKGELPQPREKDFRMGPMGPDSPETNDSLRYFTIAFSKKDGKAETIAFHVSAVTESDAQEWAANLKKESTGWTKGTYRYRVYEKGERIYVTVIDQGRELLPSFRILIISAVGEALCLVIGWFILLVIGRKIYSPIEEANRKQKLFMQNANKEFRLPLTIISGNTELEERKHGPDDETRSTRRQIEKLNELVDKLQTMGVFDEGTVLTSEIPFSELLNASLDGESANFASRGIDLTKRIAPDISISADPEAIKRVIDEVIANALAFSQTKADFALKQENGLVLFEASNDTVLPDGSADQVFDRFTVLEKEKSGAGLGLSYVKEIVKAHHGRVTASVLNGIFTLRITL